jgi:hypothetical protein
MPINPKQIDITPITHLHAYNIRNITIVRIVVPNVYITKQIANIAKYISRRRMTIKPKQITIVPIMTP